MQRPAPVRSHFTIPLVVIVLFIAACVPHDHATGTARTNRGHRGRLHPGSPSNRQSWT